MKNKKLMFKHLFGLRMLLSIILCLLSMSIVSFQNGGREYFKNTTSFIGFSDGYFNSLLPFMVFIACALPAADIYASHKSSGMLRYLITRTGRKRYFIEIFLINAICAFVTLFIALSILALLSVLLCTGKPNLDLELNHTQQYTYASLYLISPTMYVLMAILHGSIFSAVFATLALALTFYVPKKFVAWVSPALISIFLSLVAMFLHLTHFEPSVMFAFTKVGHLNAVLVWCSWLIIILASVILAWLKFMTTKNIQGE
ncbi:hypothetical protein [Mageeibacillus indolicus]|uniref:hypothetical protein n=1 Tax=Mageeibacillus indolicus TaxID=884684 RepID=UPI0004DD0F5F|nr:hypothetical protein [Mageeibacillus indolicus]KFA57181.1 hypothetical protein HMPREF1632_04955 [Mageeibacillus indolicus 0009-5]